MFRHGRLALSTLAVLALGAFGSAACDDDGPTGTGGPDPLDAETRPAVRAQLEELRTALQPFEDVQKTVVAGYDANIGCIDETAVGVAASTARGMGYHLTRSGADLIGDPGVDLMEPEFLVYAPATDDADLSPGDRVLHARLIGVEYFVPGDPDLGAEDPNPPTLFGDPFNWSDAFQGWLRHVYVFEENPDGLYSDFNSAVPTCTQLLGAEPIGSQSARDATLRPAHHVAVGGNGR